MDDLATIAERVWGVCPGCRPLWGEDQLVWIRGIDQFYIAGVGYVQDRAAELLIIGACVKHEPWMRTYQDPETGRWSAYPWCSMNPMVKDAPTQAIALLLACEALAKTEKDNE